MTATPPGPLRSSPVGLWITSAFVAAAVLILGSLIFGTQPGPGPDHWAAVVQARGALRAGRPDLAVQLLSSVQDQAPGAAEALALQGQAYLMSNQPTPGRRALERALQLKPDQPEALKMLAAVYLSYSDAPRAIKLLEQAARLEPNDFRPWYALGKALVGESEWDRAAKAYEAALQRQPPTAEKREIRSGLVRALLNTGRGEDAGPVLTAALQETPTDAELLGLAARQAREVGEVDAARVLSDRALAADAENTDALLTRARSNQLAGRPEEALPDLEKVATLIPYDLATLQLKLQVESRLGLNDRAAETTNQVNQARDLQQVQNRLTREISQRPNDPGPRWKLGQAAVAAGQATLAAQCFRAALDLDPNCQPARAGLAALARSPGPSPPRTR